MVGNAVPPSLAFHLAKSIYGTLAQALNSKNDNLEPNNNHQVNQLLFSNHLSEPYNIQYDR
ncbi:MAG: hypothetical protein HY307_00340 [Arcobacter sp.]|nr:hypothetical protein [Arcobacter sp.]